MTTSILQQPTLLGCATGLIPEYGPKSLTYVLDLTAGPIQFDIMREVMQDMLEFIQAVSVDNSANATAFTLTCVESLHKVVVAPNAQGIYILFVPTGGGHFTASGPAAKITCIFSNMPLAPNFWKVT